MEQIPRYTYGDYVSVDGMLYKVIFVERDDELGEIIYSLQALDDGTFYEATEDEIKIANLKFQPLEKVNIKGHEKIYRVIEPKVILGQLHYLVNDLDGITKIVNESDLKKLKPQINNLPAPTDSLPSLPVKVRDLSYEEEVDWLLDLYRFSGDKHYLEILENLNKKED